jgi:hypothetical protein
MAGAGLQSSAQVHPLLSFALVSQQLSAAVHQHRENRHAETIPQLVPFAEVQQRISGSALDEYGAARLGARNAGPQQILHRTV